MGSAATQEKGFLGGEQILAPTSAQRKQMKGRPIELLIDWTAEDPSKLVATLEADASVVNLGLGFDGAPPGPMRATGPKKGVRKVDSKSWAEVAELSRDAWHAPIPELPSDGRVDRSAQKKAEQATDKQNGGTLSRDAASPAPQCVGWAPEEEIFARTSEVAIVVWGLQEHPSRLIAKETGESLEDTAEGHVRLVNHFRHCGPGSCKWEMRRATFHESGRLGYEPALAALFPAQPRKMLP
ncbi:hypothetical protein AK812_SmicGene7032 [Symbiodinium microadriaticum]|uniref:Uncharacterized protein n=1 Tax=Symbiodinium microadriaticum TaxID=2951 RepID=A0A1Q9EPL1_SYMMI|nr:hypothetical protein AK812_SmicGene7032 [Symbiodinium microadriaticum]